MQLPRFTRPHGIVRDAENLRDSLYHAGNQSFHGAMNSNLVLRLGRIRILHKPMAAYREFADKNRAGIDTLEFICGVVEEGSAHLRQRLDGEALAQVSAIRDSITEQTTYWIHLETARWESYFTNTKHDNDVEVYRQAATPSTVPDRFAAGQRVAEQAIAQIIGQAIGTSRRLQRQTPAEIGWPWVYKVALSRTFKQVINMKVAGSAWNEVLPRLERLDPRRQKTPELDVSRIHHDIWMVLKKLKSYDAAVARALNEQLMDYCQDRKWSVMPLIPVPARRPGAAI